MAYVRSKRIRRESTSTWGRYKDEEYYTYYQLVEGYRDEAGKVKQRVLAHLGTTPNPDEAAAFLDRRAARDRERAADYRYAAEKLRERWSDRSARAFNRTNYGRGKWLLPKAGTPVPEKPPYATLVSPRGWQYFVEETPEEIERAAEELDAQAAEYEARAARIRRVVTNKRVPGSDS